MRPVTRMNCGWLLALMAGFIGATCTTPHRTIPKAQRTTFPPPQSRAIASRAPEVATRVTVQAAYGTLPLQFEANQGQSAEQVQFLARGSGYTVFLTATDAVLTL